MTTRAVELEGHRLALTNLEKVLWPAAGKTKAWMIEYYARIAPVILPHLRDRPLTIRRFPEGVDGPSWHQNEARGEPDWFPVFTTSGRGGRQLRFCLADDVASLVWLANNGVVELHPFQWTTHAPRMPVALVFDLDPGPPAGLAECARVALLLRDVLADIGLRSLAKTSGSLGIHVHVPLGEPHDGDRVKAFAKRVAETLARERPAEVVAEMTKALRRGKVFVDWLQNDPTRQTVAPYSLRGLPWPTVATPVTWDEIARAAGGEPEALVFLADNVLERIERVGDLFAEAERMAQTLP
jgi:bifunctional non-homologous end joining protein LigD